ncbi:hypothetical protein DAPPUDRAFT_114156 [Daphnia pulex]|uniref:Uncharacterized protein n=1 Tax=Daphnia pulex TaxID=6669 RepID=E9HH75_DAPPU|nr:hypothetical protein DAPPUDRAFT_114156 [Daphnia pulex]|eukprot:EFX68892.1 hypothetical protein DAPPUDRAFT_114156 [Daphnia pulex]
MGSGDVAFIASRHQTNRLHPRLHRLKGRSRRFDAVGLEQQQQQLSASVDPLPSKGQFRGSLRRPNEKSQSANFPTARVNSKTTMLLARWESQDLGRDYEEPALGYSPIVVVAKDFGTTYLGYAFSFIHDPEEIHMMHKWEADKQLMHKAAYEACLGSDRLPQQQVNAIYMVVDCGGGTVDITVHQVMDLDGKHLKEFHRATGGP